MYNLAIFTVTVLMAYTAYAQSHFLSPPFYYQNHEVLPIEYNMPVLHQSSDQYMPHLDVMISILLRESRENSKRWQETNVMLEKVKKEMTTEISNLKSEVERLEKLAGEKVEAERLKNEYNETKTQTEILATEFETLAVDYNKDGEIPMPRFCNCRLLFDLTYYVSRDLNSAKREFEITTNKLRKDLTDTNANLNELTTQFEANFRPTTIDRMPTSCPDLRQLGYHKSGIFSVKKDNQVESVYCDFTKTTLSNDFQTLIGTVDIKLTRVSFLAQLTNTLTSSGRTIPFDVIRTNVGNAMSTSNGIFTAPTAGTYFFACSGISNLSNKARVQLQMKTTTGDWLPVATSYSSDGNYETFALQATLVLRKGDQIQVYLIEGQIFENPTMKPNYTNFVGFLLEGELV